jgi:hypothetical protein
MVCHWDEVPERSFAAGRMRGAWTNLRGVGVAVRAEPVDDREGEA